MDGHTLVGRRVPRADSGAAVTGRAIYAADVKLPGMVYGKVLRSPYPHAKIRRVDTSRAVSQPGVLAVVTAADVPGEGVFAREEVAFEGQKVAAVAAETWEAAEEALALIEVEYEPLPAVDEVEAAIQPGAPRVRLDAPLEEATDLRGNPLNNIARMNEFTAGEVERGFVAAEVVVELVFHIPALHQVYLEPHAAVARPEPGGRVTVWSGAQGIFLARAPVAQALGWPLHRVTVIGTQVGGAFGGKNFVYAEPVAALLAVKTGRPVQVVDTRREVFLDSHPGPGCFVRAKLGARHDGTLTSLEAEVFWDGGVAGADGPSNRLRGLYRLPNYRIRSYGVYTNKMAPGPYRAPGAPQMAFVRESLLDELARQLGMDPLELRLKNAVEEGDVSIDGHPLPRIGFKETLQAVAAHWAQRKGLASPPSSLSTPKRRGWGIAAGEWTNWVGSSATSVTLNEDGTVEVITGSVDLTGTNTLFAQIAAEELGVPLEQVRVALGTTDTVPYHDTTGGSRTAYATGTTVRWACEEVKRQMIRLAADILGEEPESLEVVEGRVRMKERPEEGVSFRELAQAAIRSAEGPILGGGKLASRPSRPAYAVQIAEVEVDAETGQIGLRRLIAAQDVGCALNPLLIEGQMQGAVVQGAGLALWEGYRYDGAGHVLNPDLVDYRIATAEDVPPIETVLVEVENPEGPYGAKGVGEPPIIPTAAAIANAVADALGVRVTELPLTPERVLAAITQGELTTAQQYGIR